MMETYVMAFPVDMCLKEIPKPWTLHPVLPSTAGFVLSNALDNWASLAMGLKQTLLSAPKL